MVSGNFVLNVRFSGDTVDLTVVFKDKRSIMGLYNLQNLFLFLLFFSFFPFF